MFIGASGINCKILNFFQAKGLKNLTLCNRSKKHAEKLIHTNHVNLLEWDQLQDWKNYDWIIVGTKAPDYLLGKGFVDGITTRKLMMDLSVPRNVDPCLGRHKQITLLNIDQINRTLKIRKQKMMHTLLEAEEYVSEATLKHASLFAAKSQYLIQHNGVVA